MRIIKIEGKAFYDLKKAVFRRLKLLRCGRDSPQGAFGRTRAPYERS